MPRQTETTSQVNVFQHSPPTQDRPRSRRRSPWRLARSAVIVLGACTLAGLAVFLFSSTWSKEALASPPTCTPTLLPQPGPGRPWEAQVSVSTYSSVNTHNGNVFTAIPIVSWSGSGPDMNMMLYHNSAAVGDAASFYDAVGFDLGPGWSTSYSNRLLLDQLPNITLVRADGIRDAFTWNSYQEKWNSASGTHDVLTQVAGTISPTWRVTHKDQSYHEFRQFEETDGFARLDKVVDAAGNAATLEYGMCNYDKRLLRVHGGGRYVDFQYETTGPGSCGRFFSIFDPWIEPEPGMPAIPDIKDRSWTFEYESPSGRLSTFTGPRGKPIHLTYDSDGRIGTISERHEHSVNESTPPTWTYTYTDGRLTGVADPVDNGISLTQQFAVTCQVVGQGHIWFYYTNTTYTNRRGNTWTYRYPEGGNVGMPANAGTLAAIGDPAGTSFYNFEGSRNLLRYTDANGNFWDSTYDWRGNRLTLRDRLLHEQSWTYDGFNNVTSHTDAAGNTVRYYYDQAAYPTLLTRVVEPNDTGSPPETLPSGGEGTFPTTRLTHYYNAQLESVTDPNGVWTGLTYDQWGQLDHYSEGRVETQTAGLSDVYYMDVTIDSAGNTTGSSSSGGGGGSGAGHDSEGNPTDSGTCIQSATAGSGSGADSFPFNLPCYAPNLPEPYAEFDTASYGPRNELLTLPLDLNDGTHRTHTRAYDVMGRVKQSSIYSTEPASGGVTRTFDYTYDVANGRYKRTGPDGPGGANGTQTVVQLDWADRVEYVERRASASPEAALLMRGDYTYQPNDLVESVTYTKTDGSGLPGASVHYTYDVANRVTAIEHRNAVGWAMLRMDYSYAANDLPELIIESTNVTAGGTWMETGRTTFGYDRRNRLTSEYRSGQNAYQRNYVYDAGGNRTRKFDPLAEQETWYHYDVDADANPAYNSRNNRLMYEELINSATFELIFTKYYEYSGHGNVTRIITEHPSTGGAEMAMSAGIGAETQSTTLVEPGGGEAGGAMVMAGGGGSCEFGQKSYTAVRLGYAANGQAVTFAHDESWCSPTIDCPTNYTKTWAREFRYDGARARYMNAPLNPATMIPYDTTQKPTVWSDYDGDEIYGDFEMVGGSPVNKRSFEPGLGRTANPLTAPVTDYYHGDMLGTTRLMSNPSGASIEPAIYTAFGERISGPTVTDSTRYGYVGAWGYQSTPIPESLTPDPFPYLHVGARYYDPSSGRFLQRDPIGIRGALNVYEYVENSPLQAVDPLGLCHFCDMEVSPTDGGKIDWTSGEVGATVSKLLGMLWCHVITDNPDWGRPPPPEPKPPTEAKPPYIPGPPAPGYCFVAGTGVLTPDGPVPIEDIEVGTIVVAHDGPCGDAVERPVIRVFRGETTELVTVTFGTESVICTRPHPFYVVDRGWVEAGDLHEGDLVPTATGEPMEISSVTIRALSAPVPVYNFHVEQHHYYFVGDGRFLVHNGKM